MSTQIEFLVGQRDALDRSIAVLEKQLAGVKRSLAEKRELREQFAAAIVIATAQAEPVAKPANPVQLHPGPPWAWKGKGEK